MEYHIITDEKVYKNYKDEFLGQNIRLFKDENFYNIKNYSDGIDLEGIINYLPYCDKIFIDSSSDFINFINILLILDFLKRNKYKNVVIIQYYNFQIKEYNKAKYVNSILFENDYKNIDLIISNLKQNKVIEEYISKIPGYVNFINFYNSLTNPTLFMTLIEDDIEEYDGDIGLIAKHLKEYYSQFNISYDYFYNYLKEHFENV